MAARILIAGLLIAVAMGGGLWLHNYRVASGCYITTDIRPGPRDPKLPSFTRPPPVKVQVRRCSQRVRPSWADPVALGGVIAIVALGTAVTVGGRPYFVKPS